MRAGKLENRAFLFAYALFSTGFIINFKRTIA
jgi:hypothetical protein